MARREVYADLPVVDMEKGVSGVLNRAMYGNKDAAENWEAEMLTMAGFKQGTLVRVCSTASRRT